MNRDESRLHLQEKAPDFHWNDDIIGPEDGEEGGTWISTNLSGYYAALLNAYGDTVYTPPWAKCRGQIIPFILAQDNPIQTFKSMDLNEYGSFKIVIGFQVSEPQLFLWDSKNLIEDDFNAKKGNAFFQTSSSYEAEKVTNARCDMFQYWMDNQAYSNENIPSFHVGVRPCSADAILLDRKAKHTKSITNIEFEMGETTINYFDVQSGETELVKSYSY